jgi:MFS transporter, DHA1 family, inner membrane transport protein
VLSGAVPPTESAHSPRTGVEVSLAGLIASIALGCVGLLMCGIQPLALGALQSAGRLSIPQMGAAATFELLALGCVSASLAGRVRPRALKLWAFVGCAILIAANAIGLAASGAGFIMTRTMAGCGGGIVLWVTAVIITRHSDAPRVNAIFLASQSVTQGISAALIPVLLVPSWAANASLAVLGGTAVLVLPLIYFLPSELSFQRDQGSKGSTFHHSSLFGLAASFLVMAGIVGVWVFVEPIAAAAGISATVVSNAIAASLGAQVIGALAIAAIIRRVPPFVGVAVVALTYLLVTAALAWGHSGTAFVLTTLVFGALWTITMSLLLPLMLKLDPTRRAALLLPGTILLGSSAGPFVAGMFATDSDIGPALMTCTVMFALSVVCTWFAYRTKIR